MLQNIVEIWRVYRRPDVACFFICFRRRSKISVSGENTMTVFNIGSIGSRVLFSGASSGEQYRLLAEVNEDVLTVDETSMIDFMPRLASTKDTRLCQRYRSTP